MARTLSNYLSPNVLTSEGVSVTKFNPTLGDNAGWRAPVRVQVTYGNPADGAVRQLASAPSFSNQESAGITLTGTWGSCYPGAKWTFLTLDLQQDMQAAGQKIVQGSNLVSYGMGDNCLSTGFVRFAGGPISGDEGTGFNLVTSILQQTSLKMATISAVARSALTTTLTQAVTADDIPQTVTVASTAGLNVGDWLVISQAVDTGSPGVEAVEVISIPGAGQINAIFSASHLNGATVKPALVLTVDDDSRMGELRTLVNLDGTTYSTGTVASIAGGGFVGAGTSWAANVVGGDVLNIGAIALDNDDEARSPFNGSGENATLRSWYNITSVADTTHLGIHSFSVAGDQAYNGNGVGAGAYDIKPAVRILRLPGSNKVVCEYTATTWSVGHDVECAICPYPDVSGFQYHMAIYTPGGIKRGALKYVNNGLQPFLTGIEFTSTGAITQGWETGILLQSVGTGIQIPNAATQAILLGSIETTGADSDNAGIITWNGPYLKPNSTNKGMDLNLMMDGVGILSSKTATVVGSGTKQELRWTGGMMGATPGTFASLPTAAAGLEGMEANVTDSNTETWGATVAGGGSLHVKVRCNGTNWTVVGK
jgi:hypothetical protein